VTEPLRVLLIDDDEVDRMSVRRLLGTSSPAPAITECDSGEAALERLGAAVYDCILLDMRLPGQSGLDLLRAVRGAEIRTPVIMLTGFGDEDTAVECMKAGASDYISKSNLNGQRLANSVRQALRVHEAEQRAQEARETLRRHAEQLHALAVAATDLSVALTPDDLRQRLATVADRPEGVCLASAAELLVKHAGDTVFRYGAWHGDWSPWNMVNLADALLVWDWERFATGVPLGFDALHHELQRRIQATADARDAVEATVHTAAELLVPFGVSAPGRAVTALLYLVDLAARYLTDRQAEAGARLGVLGTWLLPVLIRRVEEL